jgi:hypothetical protein
MSPISSATSVIPMYYIMSLGPRVHQVDSSIHAVHATQTVKANAISKHMFVSIATPSSSATRSIDKGVIIQ